MNQNTNIYNENILLQLTSRPVFYSILGCIVFFIIMLFLVIYDVKLSIGNSKESVIRDTLIIVFSSLLFFGACVMFIPSLNVFKQFISQIQNVVFMVLYTVFAILTYVLTPEPILKKYANVINPSMLALGALSFYISSSSNYMYGFNMNYERIKMMIIFVCLLATLFTFYNANTGSISTIILIVASIFAFLYTLILVTSGNNSLPFSESIYRIYGLLAFFVIFLATLSFILYNQKDNFFNNKSKTASIIMFVLVISLLFITLVGANIFTQQSSGDFSYIAHLKMSLIAVCGLLVSGLLIYWISSQIEKLSGKTSIISFSLNVALVVVVLALIYKTMNVEIPYINTKKNAFFNLILSVLFYIPCMTSSLFDTVSKNTISEVNYSNRSNILMLVVSIGLLLSYYYSSIVINKVNSNGGKQLVNKPVSLNEQFNLGNYIALNGDDDKNYQYAISCWIFIDSAPPNTNKKYTTFTSLLNYGNKPNVLYNAEQNTLRIIMQQQNLKKQTEHKLTEYDSNENRILYENNKFPLQKWNNLIINYNGGTLDIFLNGELVKSSIEVSPYFTYDNLTIGEDQGILGGICNVLYFRKAIDKSKIFYLYNMPKNLSPPVLNDYNETIMV